MNRPKVLILLHPDGFCEAYADKSTDIHIAALFDDESYDEGSEQDQIDRLPWTYRDLHRADYIRATHMIRRPPKKPPGLWQFLSDYEYHAGQIDKRCNPNEKTVAQNPPGHPIAPALDLNHTQNFPPTEKEF